MSLAAGRLNKRVSIEEQVTSKNTFGETETTWVLWKRVWAAIEPLSARDLLLAQQAQSKTSARITIRFLRGLKASMRIVRGETIYKIEGVLPDKDSGQEYITLPVSSGTNYLEG